MKAAVQKLNQPVSNRKTLAIVGAVVAALLLGWGGWVLYGKVTNRPASPVEVKRAIRNYLAKKTGVKDFKPPMDIPSGSVSSGLTGPVVETLTNTVTLTNKAGRVRTVNRIAKTTKGKSGPPETAFSMYFRTNQAEAPTYEDMYKLVGQQLAVADQLLDSEDTQHKLTALVMASEASDYARTNAANLWLGARICEGYLWPNLSLVETNANTPFTADKLLNLCDDAFQEAGETNNIIRNYEYLIAKTAKASRVDVFRYRLAHIYQDLGEYGKAIALMKEIKSYRMNRVPQEIAYLEQRLRRK